MRNYIVGGLIAFPIIMLAFALIVFVTLLVLGLFGILKINIKGLIAKVKLKYRSVLLAVFFLACVLAYIANFELFPSNRPFSSFWVLLLNAVYVSAISILAGCFLSAVLVGLITWLLRNTNVFLENRFTMKKPFYNGTQRGEEFVMYLVMFLISVCVWGNLIQRLDF